MALSYHTGQRGVIGTLTYITGNDGVSRGGVIPAMTLADASGNPAGAGTSASPTINQPQGSANMATGQIAVTTSATLVAAARTGRIKITLSPTSSVVYYVGNSSVTTGTGIYVAAGSSITLDTAAAIYAIGASAVTISYAEFY